MYGMVHLKEWGLMAEDDMGAEFGQRAKKNGKIDDGFHMTNWDYGGDTTINPQSGIFLTTDLPSRRGHIWSTSSLPKDGWKVIFEFKVGNNKGGFLNGDGFAFWAAKERGTSGPVFGNRDYFSGLGIFFDTYQNGAKPKNFPIVVGMVGDGTKPYDNESDGIKGSIGHCESIYFRNLESPSTAEILYIPGKKLSLNLAFNNQKVECFSVSGITLPEDLFLGFSALTGQLHDVHSIVSVVTLNLSDAEKNNIYTSSDQKTTHKSNNSSFSSSFVKLLILCSVFGGCYYGYTLYSKSTSKRF
ncbi:L-type lectin-like domain-containing protein [Smittium culicis]|uniref:L-type lectin-like domain-containing protein n=1 Tax=Smittium culicis TaxID=133412 RepID=A0A1R1YJX5_9FUNG|nr:L-type lectin-like domain-containing protein [Smittium culicis]